MSSDEGSSGSEIEDVSTTGLIATRTKRATAGNLYATLRHNLDDEELQKELLAEDEDDVGDYEGSDKDDDDAMSSSGDEDDQGPAAEGDKEDLEGEKELKKAERAQNKKKRKLEEAKKRIPNWQKKRVKLADDAKAEDGQPAKPKKKSERSNWLPTAADAPTRQSSRTSAVANREMVHTNLKESNERSEKQKTVMSKHKERLKASQRAPISQEERFAKAARIEKETAREFGRWEREEAERQRIREEQLAAKRKRGIDGPVIRHWSGSVLWEGDKIKNKRLRASQNVDDIEDKPKETESSADAADGDNCAFTPFPAKFRDPKTGLPYADMLQFKNIQRILNDGCQWSSLLGCWAGPRYGSIGRSAVGVPDGFCRPIEEEHEVRATGQDVMKVENTG
ncbi:uncharacterized protein MYCFIDRAFT_59867 [Pseudocercospora fijiensis CIRAD86]|uniref:Uncharacterized protein n=1 Tax=Pseudocercospora fijiensis (strain CIRAD86) TaxID=383855 RepID=M3B5S5_PSEFD|nr:uncharacterized protein MYCFIDRAFT_59867 [Pseudocercospora fijiensis CIRAD86]EME84712.1 hypothetical protein MYCFIDRAFT_59867 [Pseudocercospora fijiensis CIRAD86]